MPVLVVPAARVGVGKHLFGLPGAERQDSPLAQSLSVLQAPVAPVLVVPHEEPTQEIEIAAIAIYFNIIINSI